MRANEIGETVERSREEAGAARRPETPVPEYRSPELRPIGGLELMQGRNYYRDKDAGNDNYYI